VERTLTALAAAWCVAPLAALATMYLCYLAFGTSISSDRSIANGLLGGIITVIVAAAAFIATMIVVRQYVPDPRLRIVQIADAIGTAGLLIAAFLAWRSTWTDPVPEYGNQRGMLEVEVRAPKDQLANQNAAGRIVVHFGDGYAREIPHPESIREENGAAILPVEMEVSEHGRWYVAVMHNIDPDRGFWRRYRYELPLPKDPPGAIPWSAWLKPVAKSEWDTTDEIVVRCRWKLVPR